MRVVEGSGLRLRVLIRIHCTSYVYVHLWIQGENHADSVTDTCTHCKAAVAISARNSRYRVDLPPRMEVHAQQTQATDFRTTRTCSVRVSAAPACTQVSLSPTFFVRRLARGHRNLQKLAEEKKTESLVNPTRHATTSQAPVCRE